MHTTHQNTSQTWLSAPNTSKLGTKRTKHLQTHPKLIPNLSQCTKTSKHPSFFTYKNTVFVFLKRAVSWELRWVLVLLQINQKLFSRPFTAHYNIFILLKESFTINKRRSSVWTAQQIQIVWTILDVAVFLSARNSRFCQSKEFQILTA